MIQKIHHINISVTDVEKAKAFFMDLLGFQVKTEGDLEGAWIDKVVGLDKVKAHYVQLILPESETALELIQYYHPKGKIDPAINQANQIGFRHMAFEVKQIERVYNKLKAAGVELLSDIQVYQESKKLCYFYGPDGIILELAEYNFTY